MPQVPFLTQRLWEVHKSPDELEALLALLTQQRDACDEVWFATEYGFPPLALHQAAAQQMAAAAERIRALDIVPSLQISNTLGHGEYLKYLNFDGIEWQRMVGADGEETPYSNCPRDPDFHAYLDASTRAYCAWQPASVWIDDDLRMQHHGRVAYGCFCHHCLTLFNQAVSGAYTREALVAALNAPGADIAVRRAWLAFGRESMATVSRVIVMAVHAVAPACRLGLQHGDPSWGGYNGPDMVPVFETLARVSGQAAGSRPGGGFYIDHAPRGLLHKAFFAALQINRLPPCVNDVRVEVENLPGAVSGKSARGTALEATLALAYGCTGLTFTPLMFLHEEMAWHDRLLGELTAWRPFWQRYCEAAAGTAPAGMAVALGRHFNERPLRSDEPPFAWASCDIGGVSNLLTVGLPLCWDRERAPAVLLHPNAVDGLTDDEVRALLGCGVVTDGETFHRLQQRGLTDTLPLSVTPVDEKEATERFTDDPLNGAFVGRYIGLTALSLSFPAYALTPRGACRVLNRFERADGKPGAVATAACETPAGGRWVVFGNGCWSPVVTTARRAQMLAAADWAAAGRLPVLLETATQVALVPRCNAMGRVGSVVLLNCSLDATPELRLRVRRACGEQATWVTPDGVTHTVTLAAAADCDETVVIVPGLPAWGVGVLLIE